MTPLQREEALSREAVDLKIRVRLIELKRLPTKTAAVQANGRAEIAEQLTRLIDDDARKC